MSDTALHEPFVFLEPHAPLQAEVPRRVAPRRRPEILLVDKEAVPRTALTVLLDERGFDVFQADGIEAARALAESRHSIRMLLLRVDQPGLESLRLIRELSRTRPGLWIGMRGEIGNRRRAELGYLAGADDLFPVTVPLPGLADRLTRSLPRALAKHNRVAWKRRSGSRRVLVLTTAVSLGLGILLALALRTGQEVLDAGEARLERLQKAVESAGALRYPSALPRDAGSHSEMLDFERRRHLDDLQEHRAQLEEERFGHLFQNRAPRYPEP